MKPNQLAMLTRVRPSFVFVVSWMFLTSTAIAQDKWSAADSAVVRLAPRIFEDLPTEIIANLEERGCTIPQSFADETPHNVVSGEFETSGRIDWAVLCSIDHASRVLVFFGGSPRAVSELAEVPDRRYLQGIGNERVGFSRHLSVASPEYIRGQGLKYAPDQSLPRLDHEGIEDSFVEKASVVYYYVDGKWIELQGAD